MQEHSFVICAYKESEYLTECIMSLQNQTYKSEIIAMTSTENDYIKSICKEHDIKLYINDSGKKGIAADWNFALSKVKTRYATIAHQDDIYHKDYSSEMMRLFNKHENSLIGFCDYNEIKDEKIAKNSRNMMLKKILLSPLVLVKSSRFLNKYVQSMACAIGCPSVSFDLKNLARFRFNEKMSVALDWDAWVRIAENKGAFCYVPKVLMYHRMHDDSETMKAINDDRRYSEDMYMLRKFWPKPIAKVLITMNKKK